jgi:hypothetical protein
MYMYSNTTGDDQVTHISKPGNIKFRASLIVLGLAMCIGSSMASPAMWYLWHSKIESTYVCAQTSPGEGWRLAGGPFVDAHCKKLKTRGVMAFID